MIRHILAASRGAALAALACAIPLAHPLASEMDHDPDAYVVNYYTGGGSDGVLFAAGTANQQCTDLGLPTITVVSTSPGVKLSIQPGTYVVTGTDYGYLVCKGQRLPGVVVRGTGSGKAHIRVSYPPLGQWYDHYLTLPAR
ncbi:hypothetical protein GCM10007301_34950 [Azorhizobium oxalatiphilum]|uniref:Uncharacterized protein n=1 Tax=Azorhizobium oxalatiphilum TaxID=980631 RepID=A0A917C5R7_9HYPH|nr:hypothetical protein [Azorhizobium oxalatiphilum]GGF72175.1 hypothetical protein GCM10007301_34950 [Azorhizobium oxalatiphilum]